jgi:hypothetical protein
LALHTRFGFGYQSETPNFANVDAFLDAAGRQYNQTKADLDSPSITGEERAKFRVRHLSQAHALFQLNPLNKELWDTAARIYKEMATFCEFTHVYITTGDESIPLRWCIAFAEKKANTPPDIFITRWPQRWPSEASFTLIERRDDVYYIESQCMVPYRDILSLEVFSFPKL